jgi:hypothetical protein
MVEVFCNCTFIHVSIIAGVNAGDIGRKVVRVYDWEVAVDKGMLIGA